MSVWTPEVRKLAHQLARAGCRSGVTEFDAHHLIREAFRKLHRAEDSDSELRRIGGAHKESESVPSPEPNEHAQAMSRGREVRHMGEERRRPNKAFNAGPVRAAIWIDERTREDGSTYEVGSVVIERRYKDGDEWKSTNRYNARDLANLWLVTIECMRFLAVQERDPDSDSKDGS